MSIWEIGMIGLSRGSSEEVLGMLGRRVAGGIDQDVDVGRSDECLDLS